AETAKILSPQKTVLIPDQRAGCSLADSITADELAVMAVTAATAAKAATAATAGRLERPALVDCSDLPAMAASE
ncbi:hypothetical protein B1T48_18010, partial [Mycobacterium persicum]